MHVIGGKIDDPIMVCCREVDGTGGSKAPDLLTCGSVKRIHIAIPVTGIDQVTNDQRIGIKPLGSDEGPLGSASISIQSIEVFVQATDIGSAIVDSR